MQFVRELVCANDKVQALRAWLDSCAQPMAPSALYEVAGGRRVVDEALRLSRFRAVSEPRLLELARDLVASLAQTDELNDYMLLHNDVTHIRYERGGFRRMRTT
jgi:hypothetical protein